MKPSSLNPRARRQGMALVIVLSLIVVLTIVLVSFVTQARFDASASSSFSQAVSVDSLAQDAVNSLISSLLYEIEQGSTVTKINGIPIFDPKEPLYTQPQWDSSIPADATTASLPSLIRTSGTGSLFINSGTSAMTIPQSLASSIATDQPSLDGRRIGAERWNTPMFLPASNSAAIPKWIYVTRKGPAALAGSTTDAMTKPFSGTALNPDYVIGRYAYRIYDISGLLDVNVAGYPSANAPSAERIGRKGGLALADLEGGILSGLSDGQIFPDWRWPHGGFEDYVDGEGSYQNKGGPDAGFLTTPAGANRFFSRNDLLQYLQSPASGSDAAAVAPQVSIFSRELNAPSWAPDSTVSTEAKAMNPAILSARVEAGKSFTRRDGTTAKVGEPLVNGRFPLSKLALFDDPDGNAADILKYFGLDRNSDGTWRYVHGRMSDSKFNFSGDSDGNRERLKTLQEVAAGEPGNVVADGFTDSQPREPNFFELLQAGILLESLGQGSNAGDTSVITAYYSLRNTWADRNIARHVLQIGANIIDQWDANDDPTVIARTRFEDLLSNATSDINNPDPDISGVENLPYIYKIPWVFFRRTDRDASTGTDGNPVWPWFSAFYEFQLWNPHRNAGSIVGVRNMRIIAQGEPYIHVKGSDSNNISVNTAPYVVRQNCVWPAGQTWVGFASSASQDFSSPHTLKSDDLSISLPVASSSPLWGEFVYDPPGYASKIVGFHAGSLKMPYTRLKPATPTTGDGESHAERYNASPNEARPVIRQSTGKATSFQLQKQDAEGNWLPVQTIPCIYKDTYNHRLTWQVAEFGDEAKKLNENRIFYRAAYMTADPRAFRFGFPQMGTEANVDITTDDLLAEKPITSGYFPPWLASNPGSSSWVNSELAQNTASASHYKDRGGAAPRLGDTASNSSNPYTSSSDRPIMLNRPFRSVAEMAYASRGLPWKSLNFTGDLSSPAMKNTADGALLDLFTIGEGPKMRAGVINLNTASAAVIKALLLKTEILQNYETNLADSAATSAAQAIFNYVHGTGGKRAPVNGDHVLKNPADIARMVQVLSSTEFSGWSKRQKDSLVAALAQAHSTRTWSLVLDVLAQTGKFPSGVSSSLDKFAVTGEKRLLVHLAIDRYTGEVIDQLTETVSE